MTNATRHHNIGQSHHRKSFLSNTDTNRYRATHSHTASHMLRLHVIHYFIADHKSVDSRFRTLSRSGKSSSKLAPTRAIDFTFCSTINLPIEWHSICLVDESRKIPPFLCHTCFSELNYYSIIGQWLTWPFKHQGETCAVSVQCYGLISSCRLFSRYDLVKTTRHVAVVAKQQGFQ